MPTLESNRRMIGRGIMQHYITDDEGGGDMIDTGEIINNGSVKDYEVGFRPKAVLIGIEDADDFQSTFIFTEFGYSNIHDYDIKDYNDRTETVAKNIVRASYPSFFNFTDTGFTLNVGIATGYYIALG